MRPSLHLPQKWWPGGGLRAPGGMTSLASSSKQGSLHTRPPQHLSLIGKAVVGLKMAKHTQHLRSIPAKFGGTFSYPTSRSSITSPAPCLLAGCIWSAGTLGTACGCWLGLSMSGKGALLPRLPCSCCILIELEICCLYTDPVSGSNRTTLVLWRFYQNKVPATSESNNLRYQLIKCSIIEGIDC